MHEKCINNKGHVHHKKKICMNYMPKKKLQNTISKVNVSEEGDKQCWHWVLNRHRKVFHSFSTKSQNLLVYTLFYFSGAGEMAQTFDSTHRRPAFSFFISCDCFWHVLFIGFRVHGAKAPKIYGKDFDYDRMWFKARLRSLKISLTVL